MRVQFEAGEVGHPGKCGGVAAAPLPRRTVPTGNRKAHDLNPRRPGLRRALLKEELARRYRSGNETSELGRPPAARSAPSATAR